MRPTSSGRHTRWASQGALIVALMFILMTASVALARVDPFGGAPFSVAYAPYTAGPVIHLTTRPYAPYTAGPVVRVERPYAPYTAGPVIHETERPYAPYTAGPVVVETRPYAPYTAGPVVREIRTNP